MHRYLLMFTLLLTLLGCMDDNDINLEITIDPELARDLINNACDTLTISDSNYILEATLWQDFMPSTDPDRSMTSVNCLFDLDSISIPLNIDLTKQYVILNDSIWIADYTDQKDYIYPYKLSRISRNGPEWGPNTSVNIVAEVTDGTADTTYHIKVENIVIFATY
ncbi:MAG: hypothetical protein U9Q91_03435 [Candidatus Marinimicrobia bacterium]|nr:hypothetical protein [Candidatus Neomarinimicrobiota bacterium]